MLILAETGGLEQAFIELAKASPAAAAIIFVVILFVRFIERREVARAKEDERREIACDDETKRREAAESARAELLASIGEACHQFQREMTVANTAVIASVTKALGENTTALAINTRAIEASGR